MDVKCMKKLSKWFMNVKWLVVYWLCLSKFVFFLKDLDLMDMRRVIGFVLCDWSINGNFY